MDITLGKVASWGFGTLLILAGLGALTMSIPAAIIYFLTGLFLIPNVREGINERFDVSFSRWVVVLIAVVGIGLGGAMMQGNMDTSTTTPQVDNQQNQNQQNTNTQNTKESRTHQVGDTFTVGDVQYTVNDLSAKSEIGERVGGQLMGVEANGRFLIVDMSVTNQADESIRMRTSSVKLMLGDAEYSPNTEASVYLEDSFTFEQLNPGVQTDGKIVYDVPQNSGADTAELKVSPVGLFSTAQPHYVSLG